MPLSQALPPHKTTHENGGTDEIDATGLTGAGGGSAEFDVDGTAYRLPTGKDTVAQEDPADGTEARLTMAAGVVELFADDGSSDNATINMSGSGIDIETAGGNDITLSAAGSAADINLLADASIVLSMGGAASRVAMAGGIGVTFPALTADPTPAGNNLLYFNTTTDKLRCWDGAAWNDLW